MGWVPPMIGYVLILGLTGVVVKLAQRTISWQEITVWLPVCYIMWAIVIAVFTGARPPLGTGAAWAALISFFGSTSIILFFVALGRGEASRIVPFGSTYPLLTLLASAALLSERISVRQVAGTLLIIGGAVMVTK
jgi:uncharacterized membrane protein